MNIWILKYGNKDFIPSFVDNSLSIINEINQLKHYNVFEKKIEDFHFISFATTFIKSQKQYLLEDKELIKGYSGLVIGKETTDVDLRNVKNIDSQSPEKYKGQYNQIATMVKFLENRNK
ncbi:hypothetical protein HNP99_001457 [Flavobacterium sp. 28A]|uniref:hypothetical protein n=1 Tax=Flavobacterium sp. 28A TaxID=2735895 RepID=UPI00156E58B1|nr:hypothetical protein [Flavobacterium sp. 28A]NRT15110.1 hypothetical protein [Flavobacterium sp. 28A]